MNHIYQMLSDLTACSGITGRESGIASFVAERLRQLIPDTEICPGYVAGRLGNDENKPVLVLCAHIDQIGFLVTDLTEDGFLRIGNVGGIDRRLMLGQPVIIHGKEEMRGVVSILPPHLLKGDQEVPEWGSLCVDTGYASAEELRGKIARGDAVTFAGSLRQLAGSCVSAPALDNRSGAAAVLLAAEHLSKCADLPCNVVFAFSFQEERSGRGAKLAAANLKPDYAIAVDTTFGTAHGENPQETFPLRSGAAIGISPVLSRALSDRLIAAAEKNNIPWRPEIMTGTTGTDADALALAPGGCAAGTVSIPIRYMHTPVETLDLADVKSAADLLTAFAKECGTDAVE